MGKHKSSAVWEFFMREKGDRPGCYITRCNLCEYSIPVPNLARANTSNLRKHLKARHGEEFKEAQERREEEEKAQRQNSESNIRQFLSGM